MSSDSQSPYRHDLEAAFARIGELESQLAAMQRSQPGGSSIDTSTRKALAELQITHLREDRATLIARHHSARRLLLLATGGSMIGSFAWFLYLARLKPSAANVEWAACGVVVTIIAVVGLVLQNRLHARNLRRVRTVDRRLQETQVLAGMTPTAATPVERRVRVEANDPLSPVHDLAADPLSEDFAEPAAVTSRR